MVVIGYLASVLMGVSLGLIGGGGSILTVPILFYFFGLDSVVATTYSLFIVGSTALVGALTNIRKGNVDVKTGLLFAVPSFVGVYLARQWILPSIPPTIFSLLGVTLTKPLVIMLAFATLMIVASRAMIRAGATPTVAPLPSNSSYLSIAIMGFSVGLVTGFVGAGGGFLIIPALVLLLRLPMRIAVGTSLAIIAANSLFGFGISESLGKSRDWNLLLTVTGLGVAGIFVGKGFSARIHERHLKQGFGYFVLVVGSLVLLDQLSRLF